MTRRKPWSNTVKGYESLELVLREAYDRAALTKGVERHANGNSFSQQEICTDLRLFGIAPALFQARKKIKESFRLLASAAINELLDAIVYLAAAVIVLKENR
jgi:hypothetical protein